jgi:GxxExxY protein
MELIYKEEVYDIVGAAMEVHNELGNGFLEAIYQEALEIEFAIRGVENRRQPDLRVFYKEHLLKKSYQPDFICYNKIIVEVKALSKLASEHESQLLNYLKATNMRVGVLINFGAERLDYKRMVR